LLTALAEEYPDRRFVPGVALHEFETWVIPDIRKPLTELMPSWTRA